MLYNYFQDLIGGNRLRKWFIDTHVRAKAGDKVIDIGCGPGQILPWLPPVEYIGFDVNPSYIASAQQKYGDRQPLLWVIQRRFGMIRDFRMPTLSSAWVFCTTWMTNRLRIAFALLTAPLRKAAVLFAWRRVGFLTRDSSRVTSCQRPRTVDQNRAIVPGPGRNGIQTAKALDPAKADANPVCDSCLRM